MGDQKKGFFAVKDSVCHTGTHLLLELRGTRGLDSISVVKKALVFAVKAANATLLKVRLHHFSPNKGISGVAIISESQINIHTYIIGGISNIIFTSKKIKPQSVDFFSAIPEYKQCCRNTRYYNPKMHYRSFGLPNHIENCMFN